MATISDIELVCAVVMAQGLRCMEATEAGADGLKIDYCEAESAEAVAERLRALAANVRGMFVARCWPGPESVSKPGRKTAASAPYAWRIMGTGGTAPMINATASPAPVHQDAEKLTIAEQGLAELRAKLDRQEQEFRHRIEMDAIRSELEAVQTSMNGADEMDVADNTDRILNVVDRILDRMAPLIERLCRIPSQSKPVQGVPLPTDELERLIVLIERFKTAEPEQFRAIESQLVAAYGDQPKEHAEAERS